MATWPDVQNYILSNYNAEVDADGDLKLLFDMGGGRSQFIFVQCVDASPAFVHFYSPIGSMDRINATMLMSAASETPFGVKAMGKFAAMTHVQLLDTIDAEEIDAPLALVSLFADRLEQNFGQGDTF